MQLAYVTAAARGATDTCLATAADLLRLRGIRLAGGVQFSRQRADRDRCDMELRLLPDGPALRISQDLGPLAQGCRLDADALETAVAEAARRMPGAQALIVNKFGKQEHLGRGFVPLIAEALGAGVPVVVGVNAVNLPGFLAFAGPLGTPLPDDPGAVARWVAQHCAVPAANAGPS